MENSAENEVKKAIDLVLGRGGSSEHECLIAIGRCYKTGILIEGDRIIYDVFDGCLLEDNMDFKTIPSEPGIYKCIIELRSWTCNQYNDPTEWDMDISIKSYTKIELN